MMKLLIRFYIQKNQLNMKKIIILNAKTFLWKKSKNKLTISSGGYGAKFTGNSILLQITQNKYVFIGDKIFSFAPKSEIKKFVSPIGNSDVPYHMQLMQMVDIT